MMVVMCFPSRSDRRIEPSLALRLPMLVQYRCLAAASTANPSGSFLPSSTMTFKSEPSGFTDITRPAPASRKKRRPDTAPSRLGRSVRFERLALNLEDSILKQRLQPKEPSSCASCEEFFIPQLGNPRHTPTHAMKRAVMRGLASPSGPLIAL